MPRNAKPNAILNIKILKGVILKDSALPTPISDLRIGLIKMPDC